MSTDFPEFSVDFEAGTVSAADPDASADPNDRQIPNDDDPDHATPPAGTPDVPESIPRYRFDEVNNALRITQEREAKLIQVLEQLAAGRSAPVPAPPSPPPAPNSPEAARDRIREQLFAVVPEFKKFLELQDKIPALLSASEAIPRLQKETDTYWSHVADAMLTTLTSALGKTLGSTIAPDSRLGRMASQQFFEWTASDPKLVARYEARDPRLTEEFLQIFETDVFGPIRAQAAAAKRLDTTRRLPVAGRTSAPPSQPIPKRNAEEDEDAPYKEAWDHVANARRSMTP